MNKFESIIAKAKSYLGQHEVNGKGDNQFIIDCFKYTSYWSTIKRMLGFRDEVAWCAAFINRVLAELGLKGSNSAAAKASAGIGMACAAQAGAVATWQHLHGSLKGHYHTNFLLRPIFRGPNDSQIIGWFCIGGNQSNAVTEAPYYFADHKLVATREALTA